MIPARASVGGRRVLAALTALLLAVALAVSAGVPPAAASPIGTAGPQAGISKKKCKKKSKKCKGQKGDSGKKPWAGSGYRPGMVCSLAPNMQKKYKRYGLFCLDLGFNIWTLEPL
ncbi:MAG: hypothetical protein ACSLFI_00510 [Solirubrobacterales bacterium]